MGEAIVFGMAGNILSTLSSHVVQGIGSGIGLKKELNKLKNTLSTINSVLLDADEQQLISSHELKDWVKKIKNACYEADDILDDFATEALQRELGIRDNTFKKVWNFTYSIKSVSFRFKMSRRVKEIRQNFDQIAIDKNNFHLTAKFVDTRILNQGREQTHSFVDELEVFGRDSDKDEIINMLLDGDKGSVVAIIGMGGLGKTTLAQLVYNDGKVIDCIFEVKMWVSVYQDFDVKKILRKVIKSATNSECSDLEMDQLRSRLQEQVKGKKFLLVLDDVWNEDSEKWDKLKFVMSSGAQGSKVLITTRNTNVARAMGAKSYFLKGLSSSDCWNLFEQRAFEKGVEQPNPNLVVIGKEIVEKCYGLPLAAKTIGSLMRLKTHDRDWEKVRDNDIWSLPQNENDIMPALRLSYNHLPFYLKPCFAYFASGSRNYEYGKNELIQSWIAHGFVRLSSGDSRSLEDVGNEYAEELFWRSLIQEPVLDKCGNLISFKVHDLVHNLARDIAGTEYFHFEDGKKVHNPEDIRYAELYGCPESEVVKVLCKMSNLREVGLRYVVGERDIFSSLKCLRCIWTNCCPSSVGKLLHLRKLFLYDIQTIPTSITLLFNLQTLDLSRCPMLREIPKDIGKMINLRHISLAEGAPMSHMPMGFKNLTSLRTLTVFFVGKGVGCKLNELHGLVHLEGQMTIKNLENVVNLEDCVETNLKEKRRLESLKFSWNDLEGDEDVRRDDMNVDVLETLHPHSNIKILEIEGYMGCRFASWMMEPLFPKLLEVSLVKCINCGNLPPLGELPLLRFLMVKDMYALECIEGRCENEPRKRFPSLKQLTLENLPNLENWVPEANLGALSLPSLVELTMNECPRLENFPMLPSLERLKVNCCGEKLVQSLMLPQEKAAFSLTRLKYMKIKDAGDLVSLPENGLLSLISLEKMVIKNCPILISLDDKAIPEVTHGTMGHLTFLKISRLPNLVSLPQWIQYLTKLQYLNMEFCEGLTDLPDCLWKLTSLRSLKILGCDNVKSLPDGMQQLTALEELSIGCCGSLMSWPNGMGSLVSLKVLAIGCSPNLPSLPEQLQQLTGLQALLVSNCQTMLTLSEWLVNFTSLQEFSIEVFRNLQCLPDWIPKLSALQHLCINKCDRLTSRCEKESGLDWPKIAHIPNIELNRKWIQRT